MTNECSLLNLTIFFEALMVDSCQHKRVKYEDLVVARRAAGFMVMLFSIVVSSIGMLN